MPHPLEQLRYVARGWETGEDVPVEEVASALAHLADQSPGLLLQACRRMIEYFPASGLAWWLSARALSAAEPGEAIWQAAAEVDDDPTPAALADALPSGVVMAVSPLTSVVAQAVRRRPDVGTSKKLSAAGLLITPVLAAGPRAVITTARAARAVEVATSSGTPVWAVVPRGTLLPSGLWEQLVSMALPSEDVDMVHATNFAAVVSENGRGAPVPALARPTCAAVAELLGWGT